MVLKIDNKQKFVLVLDEQKYSWNGNHCISILFFDFFG